MAACVVPIWSHEQCREAPSTTGPYKVTQRRCTRLGGRSLVPPQAVGRPGGPHDVGSTAPAAAAAAVPAPRKHSTTADNPGAAAGG